MEQMVLAAAQELPAVVVNPAVFWAPGNIALKN